MHIDVWAVAQLDEAYRGSLYVKLLPYRIARIKPTGQSEPQDQGWGPHALERALKMLENNQEGSSIGGAKLCSPLETRSFGRAKAHRHLV